MRIADTIYFAILVVWAWPSFLTAQPKGNIEFFTDEQGLHHSANLKITQDRKGFIWIASYDGLIRYDGYEFRPIAPAASDSLQLQSSRINDFMEDPYGRIWLKSNENEVYCYNPQNHRFWSLGGLPEYKDRPFRMTSFKTTPGGRTWLLSDRDGCVCVIDSTFGTAIFHPQQSMPHAQKVYNVFEAADGTSWLLTDAGLLRIGGAMLRTSHRREGADVLMAGQACFAAADIGDETWFGGTKGQTWRYSPKNNRFTLLDIHISSEVTGVYQKTESDVLITTRHDGFYLYHLATGKLTPYNSITVNGFNTENLSVVMFDAPNRLWFVNNRKGIGLYDFSIGQHYFFPSLIDEKTFGKFTPPALVLIDKAGNTWVQPKGGGFSFFDNRKKQLTPTKALSPDPLQPGAAVLYAGYFDKQNNLWFFANRLRGLGKLSSGGRNFEQMAVRESEQHPLANNVRAIMEDKEGNVWIATKEESTLAIYGADKKRMGYLSQEGKPGQKTNWESPIYCLLQDNRRRIWVGTKGNGIFRFTPNGRSLTYKVEHFVHRTDDVGGLNSNSVYAIFEDSRNRIWIGTWGSGLNLVDERGGTVRFIHHGNGLKNYPIDRFNRIRCIGEDKNGMVHAGTSNGLLSIAMDGPVTDHIVYKTYSGFANHDVLGIATNNNGTMYVSTYDGHFHRLAERDNHGFPARFKSYTPQQTHLSGALLAIHPDMQGDIWLCSEGGLSRFHPDTESFETYPEVKDLLSDQVFSESAICSLSNGEMRIGYSNGVICLNPAKIPVNNFTPYLALTDFELLTQALGDKLDHPGFGAVDGLSEIVLSHKQNFFKIKFAALDYTAKGKIRYKYKLEGLEDGWNLADAQRSATYTNISKGEYLFRVMSTNGNGVWTNNERRLKIVVQPAIWETYWAYAFYLICILGLIALIQKVRTTVFGLRHEAKMQREMAEMKMNLFTDVSHEIRTPLTMVTAPVEYLMEQPDTPVSVKKHLETVAHNARRLLKLVNQILDIRKLEQQRLRVEEVDLSVFVDEVCNDFKELAQHEHIALKTECPNVPVVVWADRDCLDKMLVNLLSNALKHCPAGSEVTVIVAKDTVHSSIQVIDNGPGIPKELHGKLFDRFVSLSTDKAQPSTGIGLSLVKDLAQRHGATVEMKSQMGQGTVFTIVFQNGNAHFANDVETEVSAPSQQSTEKNHSNVWEIYGERKEGDPAKQTGLIVEDDPKLRTFMREILQAHYDIHEAEDGIEGFRKAMVLNPDFIVSDIMMPNRDGIELLKCLRHEAATSHIPIVLLTAKADVESKLQGLSHGADDYLTKPFNVAYFKARIDNLLAQRQRLHDYYKLGLAPLNATDEPGSPMITEQDRAMMEKLVAYIRSNIENDRLSVDDLGKSVGLSRTTFFNKLKSLTGMSPVEFVRDSRLKHAARLIAVDKMLVKEACYLSGFSDLKYFGSSFKDKFGMTPSEYRKTVVNSIDNHN